MMTHHTDATMAEILAEVRAIRMTMERIARAVADGPRANVRGASLPLGLRSRGLYPLGSTEFIPFEGGPTDAA
tara:strand:- start:232 stop:450 length:219 start_codon:yes stop_codon:yes gene_type:complete